MATLQVPSKRRARGLSVNQRNEEQTLRMERSLDNLQSLLSEVDLYWKQTTYETANPLDIGLPLLDNTSVGLAHRKGEFLELKERISNGLRLAVDEHFQAFNDSVGSYRLVVENLTNAQQTITSIKSTVAKSDSELEQNTSKLASMNENLKTYNDMIEIFETIEYLKNIPSELENSINEKNYSKAQELLSSAFQKANNYRLWELPALANLQNYYEIQREQLFEIIMEEVNSILYSKRQFDLYNSVGEIYHENSSEKSNIENFLINSIQVDIAETAQLSYSNVESFLKNLSISEAADKNQTSSSELDIDDERLTDFSMNDDRNPFNQLYYLLSVVYKLEKLPIAIDILRQRNSTELNQLINRIVEDTRLRHAKLVKYLNSENISNSTGQKLKIEENFATNSSSSIVLQDLFWNFFQKLLFFLQDVKISNEIIKILKIKSSGSIPFEEDTQDLDLQKVWPFLQDEIRDFILTYIGNSTSSTARLTTTSSLLSESAAKSNLLFQFYKVEYDRENNNKIKLALQDLFPGFINSNDFTKIESPYIEDVKFLKQSTIIPSNIFNMRVILEPFLLFVQGSTLLLPEKNNDIPVKFFNNFMNKEFLPLLEESFIYFYHQEIDVIDPLEIYEPNDDLILNDLNFDNDRPKIFKFVVFFKRLFNDICFILNTSLQFRNEFLGVIFKLLTEFQEKFEELNQELLNELSNYIEPNKDIIRALSDPNIKLTSDIKLINVNKSELKHSTIIKNFKLLSNSVNFVLRWHKDYLVKKIDLNKTDINLTTVEKLRKSWSFFEIVNLTNSQSSNNNELDLNTNKIILNDDLSNQFQEIVKNYQLLNSKVENVLTIYDLVIKTL